MTQLLALFPGQGSQIVGMGKELFEQFSLARETFEEASDALKVDLKNICFNGPEADLQLTENTQPAILTVSVAAFRVAQQQFNLKPYLAAGHSLGEYSALVAAGAFPFSSAIRWVRERGRAMQAAVPAGEGAMAAVLMMEDEAVKALCQRALQEMKEKNSSLHLVLEPANFNAPGQVVISGSLAAVDQAVALVQAGTFKGKITKLNVSAPFHCSLMRPAREKMASLFSQATPSERPNILHFPYMANVTAHRVIEGAAVFPLLEAQVDSAVLWKQSMEAVYSHPEITPTLAIEFGAGKVLGGLLKRIRRDAQCLSVGDLATWKELEGVLK